MANKPTTPTAPATPEPVAATPAQPTPVSPAPAAPVTPAPEPKKDISDALAQDDAIKNLLSSKRDKKPAKAEPAKPAEPAAPATPAASATEPVTPAAPTTPAEPVKPKLNVRKPQPKPAALDADTIATAVGAAVAKALPQPKEPAAPVVELPEHIAHNKPLYEQLEKMNPTKYKGLISKQADFAKKEIAYAENWENQERQRLMAEGKVNEANEVAFNAADPQHRRFYQNAPQIDPDDVTDARVEIRLTERLGKDVNPQLEAYKREIANLRAAPEADHAVTEFGVGLFNALNPEADGTPQGFNKWVEANPLEAELASQMRNEVAPVIHSASLLWDGAIDVDPKSQVHATASNLFSQFESELEQAGDAAVDDKGRQWIPLNKYYAMPERERAKYSTTTKQSFIRYIAMNAARQVKLSAQSQMEIVEKHAKRLGYQKANVSPVTPQVQPSTQPKHAQPLVSPSVSSAAPIAATTGVAPAPVPEATDGFAKLWGKK